VRAVELRREDRDVDEFPLGIDLDEGGSKDRVATTVDPYVVRKRDAGLVVIGFERRCNVGRQSPRKLSKLGVHIRFVGLPWQRA